MLSLSGDPRIHVVETRPGIDKVQRLACHFLNWHNLVNCMSLNIRISKDSDVPLHEQVAAQIVLLIGSGKLKPGDALPSFRELATRLKIHRNTVAHAYEDFVLSLLVEKKQGSRLVVRRRDAQHAQGLEPIDDLVNSFLAEAQRRGYTLRELHQRLQQRMLAALPDRILVLSDDAGMRVLLSMELKQRIGCTVEARAVDELVSEPQLLIGALVVSPPGHIPKIAGLLPPERPVVPITYSSADSHLDLIRGLDRSSLIALVSVSEYFLKTTRAVLAPAAGRLHSMREYLLLANEDDFGGTADLVFCDVAACGEARRRFTKARIVTHRMISDQCLDRIDSLLLRDLGARE